MDAIKFLREKVRMCNENSTCNQCELYKSEIDCTGISCKKWMEEYPEDAVAFVEKWASEHPIKTRQSVFLEQWPEAALYIDGVLDLCPRRVSADHRNDASLCVTRSCNDCRRKFWLAEVEE